MSSMSSGGRLFGALCRVGTERKITTRDLRRTGRISLLNSVFAFIVLVLAVRAHLYGVPGRTGMIHMSGSISGIVQAAERCITRKDARSLVLTELKARGFDIKSPKFELDDNTSPGFAGLYVFDAYYDAPTRLVHNGTYVVDPKITALWDLFSCAQAETLAVQQLQKTLRARCGLRVAPQGIQPTVRYFRPLNRTLTAIQVSNGRRPRCAARI
jgi:hypothetical protein